MRFADLFIRGLGSYIPPLVQMSEAVQAGACPPEFAARADVESVAVCDEESPPEMASRAARVAIDRAGIDRVEIDLLLHAHGYYQGHDSWSASSYVQRTTVGAGPSPTIDVAQMSNGGMAALELAASFLVAHPDRRAALLTAADRFCLPGYDRWRSDPATPLADGAAALVLDRRRGFARVRSLASWSEPALEGMHRGDDPFGVAPFSVRQPVDMEVTAQAFTARLGLANIVRLLNEGHRAAVHRTLDEAGWTLSTVDRFVLPNLGRRRLEINYVRLFGIPLERTTWSWGRRIGHMGAADQFAGLEHLVVSGELAVGQHCLVLGCGAGFTWSGAAVEILEVPNWQMPNWNGGRSVA